MPKKGIDEEAEKRRVAAQEMAEKVRREEAARRQAEEEERVWREQEADRVAKEQAEIARLNSHYERFRRSGPVVHMMTNSVGDAEAVDLSRAIKEKINPAARRVDLSNNSIGDAGASALADALTHDTTLQELRLGGNAGIGDDGASALAQALLHNSTLRALELSACSIGDAAVCSLAASLRTNTRLNELQLQRACAKAPIGDAGVRAMCLMLCEPDSALVELSLTGCRFTDASIGYLVRALVSNERLQRLSIGVLAVGSGVAAIAASNASAASSDELDAEAVVALSPSLLSDVSVSALRNALAVNATLLSFDGPGGPLLPLAERQRNRDVYRFFRNQLVRKPLTEEKWAVSIDNFEQKDVTIGERVQRTDAADTHRAVFRGRNVLAHSFHALREPTKHGLEDPALYSHLVASVTGSVASVATVRHRNLVCVIGCAFSTLRALLVPRWVLVDDVLEGAHSLRALITQRGAMPTVPSDAGQPFYAIAFQLALALAHLHGQACRVAETTSPLGRPPLEHGSVCTSHVFYAPDAEYVFGPKQVSLAGHVRLSHLAVGAIESECTWRTLQTEEFCAPELVGCGQTACARDMYAFGCVLLEMASGKLPPASHAQRVQAAAALSRPSAAKVHAEANGNGGASFVTELIANLLDVDPARRRKASEVAEQLHALMFGV